MIMDRRDFLKAVTATGTSITLGGCAESAGLISKKQKTRPNIIFIITDQHRFDCLGCMGHKLLKTPNIDRLAEQGVLFSRAYTPSPVCAPARGSILYGKYPPGCGIVTNWVRPKPGQSPYTEDLQKAGYLTGCIGKLHMYPHAEPWGFEYKMLNDAPYNTYVDDAKHSEYIKWLRATMYKDSDVDPVALFEADEKQFRSDRPSDFILGGNFIPDEYHMTTWSANESIKFLETRDTSRPFYLHVGIFHPHQPWAPPAPWDKLYNPDDIELPPQFDARMDNNPIFPLVPAGKLAARFKTKFSREDYRRIIAAYYGNVTMIDHNVGRIFETLKKKGLWDNTVVIFTADHGDHNGNYGTFFKGDMYESSVRVPLIIKPAGGLKKARRYDKIVNTMDLYGTVLDFAGQSNWRAEDIEADSLVDVFDPKADYGKGRKNETFSIFGTRPDANLSMFRRGHFKLMRLSQGPGKPVLYEFYDMRNVPVEMNNAYDVPKYRAQRDDMKKILDAWSQEQDLKFPIIPKRVS